MKLFVAVGLILLAPVPVVAEEAPPSYVRDIKPIMTSYCMRCHQARKAKAGLDLTSVQAMLKPARRGKVMLRPGKPDESRIQMTIEGNRPPMPPRSAKQLTEKQIALVRAWIAAGAKDDTPNKEDAPKTPTPKNPATKE